MSETNVSLASPTSLFVTTPRVATAAQQAIAASLATHFHAPYVARDGRSMTQLFDETGAEVIIVAGDPFRMFHREATHPLFFHPSMAAQRIEREARGDRDRLLRVAGVRRGDVVIDATVGLASDALVFAHAVGPSGRVVGLEEAWLLATMLQVVQRCDSRTYRDAGDLLRRVEIHHVSHLAWLQAQPSDSADVVYFDPMFRTPAEASASLAPLRPFASPRPLSSAAIEEAKRVARRCVVVKERPLSGVFRRHDLIPDLPRRKIAYGVWHKSR